MLALETHAHVFASRQFPAEKVSIPKARHFAKSAYQALNIPTGTIELVVSELVTNGVLHTRRPVRVSLFTPSDDVVHIEVADTSFVHPKRRQAAPTDPNGRGMELTEALSETFEVADIPGGKVICVSISIKEDYTA